MPLSFPAVMRLALYPVLGSWNLLLGSVGEALNSGNNASISSMLCSRLTLSCNLWGKGKISLTRGSSLWISLITLLWSRLKRTPVSVDVM